VLSSCRFSLHSPRASGKGWKTRGQNQGWIQPKARGGERERERGGGGREGELCGESVARMRMNSGGRVQHEMGGGGKAPSPEAETVTLL